MAVSFSEQVIQFLPRLTTFARRLSGNSSTADDLVQETVLRAFTHAEQFTPGTNLLGWLCVILRNCYFNELRGSRHLVSLDAFVSLPMASIDRPQESRMTLADVACRFATLPAAQQQALALVGAKGHSYEDAAKVANCAVGTMKSRVSRARTELQHLLDRDALPPKISHQSDYDHLDNAA